MTKNSKIEVVEMIKFLIGIFSFLALIKIGKLGYSFGVFLKDLF